jgi:gliding motility-associated-like protein
LYTVRLIVTDNIGCVDTVVKTNYIDIRDPVPGFYASDSNVCMKELVAFTNTTTGSSKYTSLWYFGDGTTDTAKNPVHAYQQTGAFTVKLVITDSIGCKDSITKTAYINISHPNAQFTASDTLSICPPLNVIFTNTSQGGLTYAWDLGNGTTTTLQNPTGSYTTPGVYQVRLIALNAENCRDTAYGRITVLGYSGMLNYTPLKGCAPLLVGFKSQLYNIPSVIWDFSDGVTQPANGIDTTTHLYTTPGSYVPKLILSDNSGCQNSSLGLDTIKVDGIKAGFVTSSPCVNTPVTFVDTSFSYFSALTSWQWSFNNGQLTATGKQPSFVFPAGTYPVTLVATNANGCKDSLTSSFTIYDLPKIVAVSDTTICKGDAASLSATGGVLYIWTPATTLSCDTCQSPSASPTVATSYVVTGTDIHGCSNKDTVKVSVQTKTTSIAGPGGAICADSSLQLLASGAHRYEWSPAGTLSNHLVANPVASPVTTTDYIVIAWEGSCTPDTNTVRVVVYPKPTVDAGSDETIVAGTGVMLTAKGTNIETYKWSPAQSLSCESCSNPTASPSATTRYKVVVMSEQGCKAFDTVLVRVLCHESQVFIPNSFSPNGDGQNDVFYPRGVGLQSISSMRIYNRWGELMFEKRGIPLNDRSNGWDGTYRGSEASADVFVYVIEGICENGETISWKGDVTLLR